MVGQPHLMMMTVVLRWCGGGDGDEDDGADGTNCRNAKLLVRRLPVVRPSLARLGYLSPSSNCMGPQVPSSSGKVLRYSPRPQAH